MPRRSRISPELRDRAIRMVQEQIGARPPTTPFISRTPFRPSASPLTLYG
jgi:hypothetical protein